MAKKPPTQEFRVGISGVRLPAEAAERINRAVQKAVLMELAGLNLKVGLGIRFVGNGGGTQGIEVIAQKSR